MNTNMMPHEGVRQMHMILALFRPEGDSYWCMRQIRDIAVVYMRVLSQTYPHMKGTENAWVVNILVVEACKRRVEEI